MYLLFTSLVFLVLASCIPFMGNDLRSDQGRGTRYHSCAVPFVREAGETWPILDIRRMRIRVILIVELFTP